MSALLLLIALAGAKPDCGGTVVSGTGPLVSLYDRSGAKVVDLKVKDNSLSEPLPIIRCTDTMVLVSYQNQQLRADRFQIVTRDADEIMCISSTGGSENRSSMRTMNGLSGLACHPPKPAPNAAPAKSGKKK